MPHFCHLCESAGVGWHSVWGECVFLCLSLRSYVIAEREVRTLEKAIWLGWAFPVTAVLHHPAVRTSGCDTCQLGAAPMLEHTVYTCLSTLASPLAQLGYGPCLLGSTYFKALTYCVLRKHKTMDTWAISQSGDVPQHILSPHLISLNPVSPPPARLPSPPWLNTAFA